MAVKEFFKNGLAALTSERPREIIITTAPEIGSRKNTRTIGPVWGHGTPIDERNDADHSASVACDNLLQRAKDKRADAVIDLRLELRQLPEGAAYMAYGTAVHMRHIDEWE